jgi:toxin FitB
MRYLLDTNRREGRLGLREADGRQQGKGRPRSALDAIIAAVAQANDCVVVTDNEADFAAVEIINPMRGSSRGSR